MNKNIDSSKHNYMKLVAIVLAFWLLFVTLTLVVYHASSSVIFTAHIVVIYYCLSRQLEDSGYQSVWLRDCWLIRWLQAYLSENTDFTFDPQRQSIVAVEPHGPACLGFASAFAPSVGGKTRVVASSLFLLIPFLRDIYFLSGVISSARSSFERALARQDNLAVVPSGIRGLYAAIVDRHSTPGVVRVYKVSLGFCSMAIKHKTLLYPALSIGEDETFARHRLWERLPFLSTLAFYRHHRVRTVLGEPLDAALYTSVARLGEDFYENLRRCAATRGIRVELIDWNKRSLN